MNEDWRERFLLAAEIYTLHLATKALTADQEREFIEFVREPELERKAA